MATRLSPGQEVNGYTIVRLLTAGAFAMSYEARGADGSRVFLKQYKSPSPRTPWYREYVEHQQEIRRRVEEGAQRFCYRFIDLFECKAGSNAYFQVFEFVDKGRDLETLLAEAADGARAVSWEQRLILAKVMIAGIATLHRAGVAHCDLKPANLHLIEDSTVKAGHVLKVIDLDFAVLTDRSAPWDKPDCGQAYVGTPGYLSPEHLRFSLTDPHAPRPGPASDVFTSGLILYELLTGRHPYGDCDDAAYPTAVLAYGSAPPTLMGAVASTAGSATTATEFLADTIYSCLDPEPAKRPTADHVLSALRGESHSAVATSGERAPATGSASRISLAASVGEPLVFGISTSVGRHLVRRFGEDCRYFHDWQFTLHRDGSGCWMVEPNLKAPNSTLLNGRTVSSPMPISSGDVIAVGNESTGVIKLPLVVSMVE